MAEKALSVTSMADVRQKVGDVEVHGDPGVWRLLCKASSKAQGWMKSTKVLEIPGYGCLVQVSTQQGDVVAESVCVAPGVCLVNDDQGRFKLVAGVPTPGVDD